MFDLTAAAPDPATIMLLNAVPEVQFEPNAVRVVSSRYRNKLWCSCSAMVSFHLLFSQSVVVPYACHRYTFCVTTLVVIEVCLSSCDLLQVSHDDRYCHLSAASTTLLVGGVDKTYGATHPGVVIIGTIAVGSSAFITTGSVVLPSLNGGVTALSQTSAVVPGYVLASTDQGVFKCAHTRSPLPPI